MGSANRPRDNLALQRSGRAERSCDSERGSAPGRPLNAGPFNRVSFRAEDRRPSTSSTSGKCRRRPRSRLNKLPRRPRGDSPRLAAARRAARRPAPSRAARIRATPTHTTSDATTRCARRENGEAPQPEHLPNFLLDKLKPGGRVAVVVLPAGRGLGNRGPRESGRSAFHPVAPHGPPRGILRRGAGPGDGPRVSPRGARPRVGPPTQAGLAGCARACAVRGRPRPAPGPPRHSARRATRRRACERTGGPHPGDGARPPTGPRAGPRAATRGGRGRGRGGGPRRRRAPAPAPRRRCAARERPGADAGAGPRFRSLFDSPDAESFERPAR